MNFSVVAIPNIFKYFYIIIFYDIINIEMRDTKICSKSYLDFIVFSHHSVFVLFYVICVAGHKFPKFHANFANNQKCTRSTTCRFFFRVYHEVESLRAPVAWRYWPIFKVRSILTCHSPSYLSVAIFGLALKQHNLWTYSLKLMWYDDSFILPIIVN